MSDTLAQALAWAEGEGYVEIDAALDSLAALNARAETAEAHCEALRVNLGISRDRVVELEQKLEQALAALRQRGSKWDLERVAEIEGSGSTL